MEAVEAAMRGVEVAGDYQRVLAFDLFGRQHRWASWMARSLEVVTQPLVPFTDPDYIAFCCSLPLGALCGQSLYRRTILALNPSLGRFPETKTGMTISTGSVVRARWRIASLLRARLPEGLRRLLGLGPPTLPYYAGMGGIVAKEDCSTSALEELLANGTDSLAGIVDVGRLCGRACLLGRPGVNESGFVVLLNAVLFFRSLDKCRLSGRQARASGG
jgi:hypothetical protein